MSQRYELKGKIGEGGIGTVHQAFDTQLKRDVAIKRLIPVDGGTTEAAAENLIKEATTLSALQHPNIVTVYDVGSDDQGGFVVMELLKGETFDETINRGALTYADFHNVVTQTLEALIAAHHTGLIHRDLKPSNLMVNWMPSGKFQIKILDFGLAKFSKQPSVQTIDQGDAILGSIYFMAPEQFERIPLDARTDLYSMGCMYYQSLTGKFPFDGDTAPMVMASHLQNRVQPLANLRPDLPLWLCDWVMWLISRKMDDRPESAKFAYERFQAEKASPAGEAAAEAAAAAAEAHQRAAVANFQPPVPAHPPAGYGTTQPIGAGRPPLSMAPKPGFPKWAMVTIPLLLALAIGIAVSKFGGRSERKNREELMVKLHEMVEQEESPPGNRATVDVVVDYMLDHSDNTDTTNSAIRILSALEGDGVDAAIADNLEKIESSRQLQGMLLTIGQRGYQAGTPALMAYAAHKNADVQRAALAALTQLDGRQQLPKLVDLAVKSVESGNGNPYSDYIVQIASAIPNPDLRTEAIRKAVEPLDGKTRGEILKMLGYLGGEAALGTIKDTLAGDDKDAKIGALLGLARWPDSSPNEILFEAATDSSDSHLQLVGV
ncbi:MAG: protein kinase domain-containing protein, partial [Verrucomicrobiales bacterium]